MAAGVALSEDLRGVLIRMHILRDLSTKSISNFTLIPLRTVQSVLTAWKRTGEVKPVSDAVQGRPRALDFADTQVHLLLVCGDLTDLYKQFLATAVNRHNDRYLDELRDLLEERCGVRVSESTIWRTLHRVGFRMKAVSFSFRYFDLLSKLDTAL